jgi:hypothetical protein
VPNAIWRGGSDDSLHVLSRETSSPEIQIINFVGSGDFVLASTQVTTSSSVMELRPVDTSIEPVDEVITSTADATDNGYSMDAPISQLSFQGSLSLLHDGRQLFSAVGKFCADHFCEPNDGKAVGQIYVIFQTLVNSK